MSKNAEKLSGTYLVTDDEVFLLDEVGPLDGTKAYQEGYAYLDETGTYFYTFKGVTKIPPNRLLEDPFTPPGIYLTKEDRYILVPVNDEFRESCEVGDKIAVANRSDVVDVIVKSKELQFNVPESSKLFKPVITEKDDILKRAIKAALIAKDIDIDQYKGRFADKNALFNFKQVVKNPDSKLSILLFERGCKALNLKFTITVEEEDPDVEIGKRLNDIIVVSSDDTV